MNSKPPSGEEFPYTFRTQRRLCVPRILTLYIGILFTFMLIPQTSGIHGEKEREIRRRKNLACNFPRERARVIAEKNARRVLYVGRRESVFPWLRDQIFRARKTRWFIINERWADFRRKPLIIEPCRLPRNRARSLARSLDRTWPRLSWPRFPTTNYNLRALHYFPSLVSSRLLECTNTLSRDPRDFFFSHIIGGPD